MKYILFVKPKKIFTIFCLIFLVIGTTQARKILIQPAKVIMNVDLATPVMEANKAQTAFVKISLTGFKLKKDIQRTPVNVAIVLDRSGSMSGEKLKQAKQAAIMAVNMLDEKDIVSIVSYESNVEVVVSATKVKNKSEIEKKINNIRSAGSTALFAGVSKGAFEVRKFVEKNNVNRVILLSDGLANVGPQSPAELGQLGMSLGKEGISVTTIGLGLGYNEDLMTKLAGYSDGNHAFVKDAEQLVSIFQKEFGDVLSVVARDVEIEIQCKDGFKPLRIIGRDGEIIGNKVSTRLNQLYSTQEKYIVLELKVPAHKAGNVSQMIQVDARYHNLASKRTDNLSEIAEVKFSKSKTVVKDSINEDAYVDAIGQIANEQSKKAIIKRDKGDIKGAQQILRQNSLFLKEKNMELRSPSASLRKKAREEMDDAEMIVEDKKWGSTRKKLKAKQYKREKQQYW